MITLSSSAFAQVIIGDAVGTATDKRSVLLEFAANQNKGLILPYVKNLPTGSGLSEGTLVLDATDATKAKVKYYNGASTWVDLSSGNTADITSAMALQNNADAPEGSSAQTSNKVVIGAAASSASGVLVLESASKAMVLPTVASTDDVVNPAPGMMVYVNKTGAKRLAVFNGTTWTYWRKIS